MPWDTSGQAPSSPSQPQHHSLLGGVSNWVGNRVTDFARDLRGLFSPTAWWHGLETIPKTRFSWKLGFYTPGTKAKVEEIARTNRGFSLSAAARAIQAGGSAADMMPLVNTYAGLTTPEGRKQLEHHPLLTAIDVSSIVAPIVKGIAGPEAAARAAESAAEEAASHGASTEQIAAAAKQAATLAMHHAGKHPYGTALGLASDTLQKYLERTHPTAAAFTPAKVLEAVGLGQLHRRLMETVGPAGRINRVLSTRMGQWSKEVMDKAEEYRVSKEQMQWLAKAYEDGTPGWRRVLEQPGMEGLRGFTHYYEDKLQEFGHLGLENKTLAARLFGDKAELIDVTQVKRLQGYERRIKQLQQKMTLTEQAIGDALSKGHPELANELRLKATRYADQIEGHLRSMDAVVPARFRGVMQPRIRGALIDLIRSKNPVATEEAIGQLLDKHLAYGSPIPNVSRALYNATIKDVSATWMRLRDEGYDPIFMHHVGDDALRQMSRPNVVPHKVPPLTQAKAYAWAPSRFVSDVSLSLIHQGYEWMMREHQQYALNELVRNRFVLDADKLAKKFEPEAEALIRQGKGEGRNVYQLAVELGNKHYTKFTPGSMFPFAKIQNLKGDLYIPKSVERTLRFMKGTEKVSKLERIPKLGVDVFRVSALTLSPNYYLHIALSTGLIDTLELGPVNMARFMKNAVGMAVHHTAPEELIHAGPLLSDLEKATAGYHVAAGGAIRQMLSRVDNGLSHVTSFIHDVSQNLGYLTGEHEAIKAGLSEDAAARVGIDQALDLAQRWDRMVPLERIAVRNIFPFYGWMSFLFRKALTMPFDHPYRFAILSTFARKELDDWQTGLPERFMSYLFPFKPDSTGKQMGIPAIGIDPFEGVANYFTLAGLYSHVNPEIRAVLTQMGVDPISAEPAFSTQMRVDPVSGYEVPVHPSFLGELVRSLVGQSQAVSAFTDTDLKNLRKTDPQAWLRIVYSALGFRFLPTKYDLPSEIAKVQARQTKVNAYNLRYGTPKTPAAASSGGGWNTGP